MRITEDSRKIKWLAFHDGTIIVDSQGITKIEAYDECGQGAYVPWFKVWKGDYLYCRINGADVEQVGYKPLQRVVT